MRSPFTLSSFQSPEAIRDQLEARQLSVAAAAEKSLLFEACAHALAECGADPDRAATACFVPGRIEVLGKHTDYAGGRSLICTVERGFCFVVQPREDPQVRVLRVEPTSGRRTDPGAEEIRFELAPEIEPRKSHWSLYVITAARRLARNFPSCRRGADLAFASDLPPASGMSSSSALLTGMFLVLEGINRLSETEAYLRNIPDTEALAGYLGTIENGMDFGDLKGDRGAGTFGGSEDHTAILCSRPGILTQYSYCPVRLERRIEFSSDHVLAVGKSGVVAEKTGDAMEKYNRASALAAAVARAWREATGRSEPHIAAILASDPPAGDRLLGILSEHPVAGFESADLVRRFEHFRLESEVILPAAGDALAAGDFHSFGEEVARSQKGAEALLGNQVPETIFLTAAARECGAVAASAFGAGFGGSVWALVPRGHAEEFLKEWAARYRDAFPEPADRSAFFLSPPGPAAIRIG